MTNLVTYTGQDPDDLIDHNKLYWIAAKDKYYVNRPTLLGTVITPNEPWDLKAFPHKAYLDYTFKTLPAWLISQTHDFFKRTEARLGTEAEILIAFNPDVEEHDGLRIFVPPQKVTHGSVNSGYDPTHLGQGWQIIGSIHSHANFGAFHSGTDTNDASEFDGIHITIGNVDTEKPSFAAMASFNKTNWTLEIEQAADISGLGTVKAPEWWDRYILNDHNDPKIMATFEANKKPERPTPKTWTKTKSDYGKYEGNKNKWMTPYQMDKGEWKRWNEGQDDWSNRAAALPTKVYEFVKPEPKMPKGDINSERFEKLAGEWQDLSDVLRIMYGVYPGDLLETTELFNDDDYAHLFPNSSTKGLLPEVDGQITLTDIIGE